MTSTTPATVRIELAQLVDLGAVTATVRIAAPRTVLTEDAATAVRLGLEQLATDLETDGAPVDTTVFTTRVLEDVGNWVVERATRLLPAGASVSAEVVHQEQPGLVHHTGPRS